MIPVVTLFVKGAGAVLGAADLADPFPGLTAT